MARFNSQPPEGGWLFVLQTHHLLKAFQLTAARRRLDICTATAAEIASFNSQPPEGGWSKPCDTPPPFSRFNSQPPEGGWLASKVGSIPISRFNSQPPEGGWSMAA